MSNATALSLNAPISACRQVKVSPDLDATPIVYVVDDDASVRQSLEMLIDAAGWQVETYASAVEFLASSRPAVPSCLVLDVWLPGISGLELQERIGADRVDVPIIFVTAHGDVPTTVQAMKRGAVEVLTKPFRDHTLLDAIEEALDRSRTSLAYDAEMEDLRQRYGSLSAREREVMALVVTGRLNKQVAADLGISVITVKAHRGQAMRKMGAGSLPHLVEMAAGLTAGSRGGARAMHPRLWDAA